MQVADDDARLRGELLRVALVERDVCRERLMDGFRLTVGSAATESHGRPPSPATGTTSTASRSACF
jgi:hypothetical protein